MPRVSWSRDPALGLVALIPATCDSWLWSDLPSWVTRAQSTRQFPHLTLTWRGLWTSSDLNPGGRSGPCAQAACLSSVCLPVLSVCLPVLSVCLPVPLTRSVSHVSLCRSVSFSLSCSLSHYCCTNVSPERCDGSVITREFPPCRLFPLPPLLTSPQAGNDLPWPRARSGVMSQLVPDFVAQSVFSGFLSDSPGHFPH